MSENHWIENNRRVIEEFHTNGGRVQRWPPFNPAHHHRGPHPVKHGSIHS